MTRPVVFFEIHGKDGEGLKQFYASLFGWKIDSNNPMGFGFVEPGIGGPEEGVGGGIMQAEEPLVTIYVQVVDLNETLAKAEEMGGKAVLQPMDWPGGGPTIAALEDPEGNTIGLVKQ
jgi:predicted enzyme related to lactoylglutathione lyase